MKIEEQIMNDPNLARYVDKQRGWIHEAFMDGVMWADEHRPVDWQQVRIQAAIAAMQGIISNEERHDETIRSWDDLDFLEAVAKDARLYADNLVEELKRTT